MTNLSLKFHLMPLALLSDIKKTGTTYRTDKKYAFSEAELEVLLNIPSEELFFFKKDNLKSLYCFDFDATLTTH